MALVGRIIFVSRNFNVGSQAPVPHLQPTVTDREADSVFLLQFSTVQTQVAPLEWNFIHGGRLEGWYMLEVMHIW